MKLKGWFARGTPAVIYLDETLGRRARRVSPVGAAIKEQKQVSRFVGETPKCSQFSTLFY